jgi:16S rRNA (uracil1498-N3)-methyltransferase
MADRFYTEQPLSPGEFVLDGAEAHHLAAVRRFEAGDRITLFNGDGFDHPAEVLSAGKKQVAVVVGDRVEANREHPFPIRIASALPKGDRADFMLEKLVELGVAAFVPLVCERSAVVPREFKREKYRRAVVEASKQCGRNVLMEVRPPVRLAEFLKEPLGGAKRILHPGVESSSPPGTVTPPPAEVAVNWLIGPEGGFTESEVLAALDGGWSPARLGPRILRIETAAIAAAVCSLANFAPP